MLISVVEFYNILGVVALNLVAAEIDETSSMNLVSTSPGKSEITAKAASTNTLTLSQVFDYFSLFGKQAVNYIENNIILKISIVVLLALLSAIFSGLTLGLMSLDVLGLKILMETGKKRTDDAKAQRDSIRAKRIYRLRKDGNFLLMVLVISNVAVNTAFSILTSGMTNGVIGFIVSTTTITFIGEVFPQILFKRYTLLFGYYLMPLVYFVSILLYVLTKPLSIILDNVLGEDIGMQYTRDQLKTLFLHYQKEFKMFQIDEAQILMGGLDIAAKKVSSVMTPMKNVYGLDLHQTLNYSLIAQIVATGYSRIPVFDKSKDQCIIGLLYTKDLALLSPDLKVPIHAIFPLFKRPVYAVDTNESLLSVLSDFKKGRSHLAVVREVVVQEGGDPFYKHVGIITLEDIIEELIQDEILDEYEQGSRSLETPVAFQQEYKLDSIIPQYSINTNCLEKLNSLCSSSGNSGNLKNMEFPQNVNRANSCHVGNDYQVFYRKGYSSTVRHTICLPRPYGMSFDKLMAVQDLLTCHPAFQPPMIITICLAQLIQKAQIIYPQGPIYERNKPSSVTTVILDGVLQVTCADGDIQSFVGPWKVLGFRALGPPPVEFYEFPKTGLRSDDIESWNTIYQYKPDFIAQPQTQNDSSLSNSFSMSLRCLQISREAYIQASLDSYSFALTESLSKKL